MGMLVLSRQKNEEIIITAANWGEISITVIEIRGDKIRLGINAPREFRVNRKEVHEAIKRQQSQSTKPPGGSDGNHN